MRVLENGLNEKEGGKIQNFRKETLSPAHEEAGQWTSSLSLARQPTAWRESRQRTNLASQSLALV